MVTTTEDTCIIAGDFRLIDEGKINLVKLTDSRDKVTVGDKVVTSDISSRFLPGILIGYISEISMDSNNLTKSGYITPANRVSASPHGSVDYYPGSKEVANRMNLSKQAQPRDEEPGKPSNTEGGDGRRWNETANLLLLTTDGKEEPG